MEYVTINGTGYEAEILKNKTVDSRRLIEISISTSEKGFIRELLQIEKHGSCWFQYRSIQVCAVLSVLNNSTVRKSHEVAFEKARFLVMWCED